MTRLVAIALVLIGRRHMEIKELVTESHNTASNKGWWDIVKSPLEIYMLIVSEITEAAECARGVETDPIWISEVGKPEGEAVELADAVIRIADWCGHKGWDLEKALRLKMEYNKIRSYRHGNKKY